jgi:hypothetical protein
MKFTNNLQTLHFQAHKKNLSWGCPWYRCNKNSLIPDYQEWEKPKLPGTDVHQEYTSPHFWELKSYIRLLSWPLDESLFVDSGTLDINVSMGLGKIYNESFMTW